MIGVEAMCRKSDLAFALNLVMKMYPLRSWHTPATFILPDDLQMYKEAHNANKSSVFIAKLSASSQGAGIKILTDPSDLMTSGQMKMLCGSIVQKYIENPLLLDGLKHDLRLYLLIANSDPMVAFINDEGLARFCTEKYVHPYSNGKYSVNAQLTNYSINKSSNGYIMTEELLEVNTGTKRTLTSYWKTLEKEGYDVRSLKEEINSLCRHMLKAMQPHLRHLQHCKLRKGAAGLHAMHIVGVDVIIDDQGRPWLLEANATPSMAVEFSADSAQRTGPTDYRAKALSEKQAPISAVDFYVKTRVVADAVRLCSQDLKDIISTDRYSSYKQIYSPKIESQVFGDSLSGADDLWSLYRHLCGTHYQESIQLVHLFKLLQACRQIGKKALKKIDIEIFAKKCCGGKAIDFRDFCRIITTMVEKMDDDEYSSLGDKLKRFFDGLDFC